MSVLGVIHIWRLLWGRSGGGGVVLGGKNERLSDVGGWGSKCPGRPIFIYWTVIHILGKNFLLWHSIYTLQVKVQQSSLYNLYVVKYIYKHKIICNVAFIYVFEINSLVYVSPLKKNTEWLPRKHIPIHLISGNVISFRTHAAITL